MTKSAPFLAAAMASASALLAVGCATTDVKPGPVSAPAQIAKSGQSGPLPTPENQQAVQRAEQAEQALMTQKAAQAAAQKTKAEAAVQMAEAEMAKAEAMKRAEQQVDQVKEPSKAQTMPATPPADVPVPVPAVLPMPMPEPAPMLMPEPAPEPMPAQVAMPEPEEQKMPVPVAPADPNLIWNDFLAKYMVSKDNISLLRYGAVSTTDKQALKAYVKKLEGMKPSQMSRDEALAFWFNLYNAKTIDIILANYPVKSIRDIGGSVFSPGPWKTKVLTVEGKGYSLDNIEHDTVRVKYKEPRIHYAFNCASIGCPNLAQVAWTADNLEAGLTAAARGYIAHPRGVRIKNGEVKASNIYKWFKKDFGSSNEKVLAHLAKYATGEKKAQLQAAKSIKSYDYNWNLNEAK